MRNLRRKKRSRKGGEEKELYDKKKGGQEKKGHPVHTISPNDLAPPSPSPEGKGKSLEASRGGDGRDLKSSLPKFANQGRGGCQITIRKTSFRSLASQKRRGRKY